MEKHIHHIKIDNFFENIFHNYSSKHYSENELSCNFLLDKNNIMSKVCYRTDPNTDELIDFSIELSPNDNIAYFLSRINEPNYIDIVYSLNNFYNEIYEKIESICFTFSNIFVLKSILLIDINIDMDKEVTCKDKELIVNEHNLNITDYIDLIIAQHIDNSELIDETIMLPNYHSKEDVLYFLKDFRENNIKKLYMDRIELIKSSIEEFSQKINTYGIPHSRSSQKFKERLICDASHHTIPFFIDGIYDKRTNDLNIVFNTRYTPSSPINSTKDLSKFVLNKINQSNIFKQILELNEMLNFIKPIETIEIYFNPDTSLKVINFNNTTTEKKVSINHQDLNFNENLLDIMIIKYLYIYCKELIDSQHFLFINEFSLLKKDPDWPSIINEYHIQKESLLTIIKMQKI